MNENLKNSMKLYTTWKMASEQGYLYFEGNGLQGLTNLMASQESYELFLNRRSHCSDKVRHTSGFIVTVAFGADGTGTFFAT